MKLRAVLFLAAGLFLAGVQPAVTGKEPVRFFFEMVRVPGADYWVGKYEVTQKQYVEITGESPSYFKGDDKPVDSVSWDDAVTFCEKLTAREHAAGRLPKEYAYDLPTDAQWDQFAAGTESKDAVVSLYRAREGTEPVGTTPPNPCGLHDIIGNVWEWCRDWYGDDIRKKDANPDMPYVPTRVTGTTPGPEETFKILRGGAWDTSVSDRFSLASRLRYAPGMSNYRTGFRCVVVRTGAGSVDQGTDLNKLRSK